MNLGIETSGAMRRETRPRPVAPQDHDLPSQLLGEERARC